MDDMDIVRNTEGIWIDPSLFPSGKDALVEVVVIKAGEGEDMEVWRSPSIPYKDLDVGVMETGVTRSRSHVTVFNHSATDQKGQSAKEDAPGRYRKKRPKALIT